MKADAFRRVIASMTPTRYYCEETNCRMYVVKCDTYLWRIAVAQDGEWSVTGPKCRTKAEAFSVLPDVAKNWGLEMDGGTEGTSCDV